MAPNKRTGTWRGPVDEWARDAPRPNLAGRVGFVIRVIAGVAAAAYGIMAGLAPLPWLALKFIGGDLPLPPVN